MNAIQRKMVGHAAIIMIVALLAGFGLAIELVGGFEYFPGKQWVMELPSDSAAWARTHVGGLLNGMLVFVVALLLWGLNASTSQSKTLAWMVVGTGYGNTVFYWAGLFAANRALTFGDNRFGDTSFIGVIGFLPAFLFAGVLLVAMVLLARMAFAGASSSD